MRMSHAGKERNFRRFVTVMCAVATLTFAGVASAYKVRGQVIAGGGTSAPTMSNGVHSVYGTVGQAAYHTSFNANHQHCAGFWCFGGPRVVAVPPAGNAGLPTQFAMSAATPNPMAGETRFHLALPRDSRVTLRVYDVRGRGVGEVVSEMLAAGEHELFWSPPAGAAGIYFLRLETDGAFRASRRMVVLR